jgi:hypothetical protein
MALGSVHFPRKIPMTATAAKRRKRADLKRLVLEAGVEVLERDGIGFGAEDLTYAKVFEHLEQTAGLRVTRGSVHERIWESQRDFQLEVLAAVVEWDVVSFLGETRATVEATVNEADLSTHAAREEAMRFLLRVTPMQSIQRSKTVDKWALWHATVHSVFSHSSTDENVATVRQVATTAYHKLFTARTELYFDAAQMLGYRIRQVPGLTERQMVEKWTSMILAMADGFSIREGAGLIEAFELPSGPDGSPEQWDDFSFALWQVMPAFLENPLD